MAPGAPLGDPVGPIGPFLGPGAGALVGRFRGGTVSPPAPQSPAAGASRLATAVVPEVVLPQPTVIAPLQSSLDTEQLLTVTLCISELVQPLPSV